MSEVFRVGDRVRTLPVKTWSDLANKDYSGRTGTVTAINGYGTAPSYEVTFDEPVESYGYVQTKQDYYYFDNGLERIEEVSA